MRLNLHLPNHEYSMTVVGVFPESIKVVYLFWGSDLIKRKLCLVVVVYVTTLAIMQQFCVIYLAVIHIILHV